MLRLADHTPMMPCSRAPRVTPVTIADANCVHGFLDLPTSPNQTHCVTPKGPRTNSAGVLPSHPNRGPGALLLRSRLSSPAPLHQRLNSTAATLLAPADPPGAEPGFVFPCRRPTLHGWRLARTDQPHRIRPAQPPATPGTRCLQPALRCQGPAAPSRGSATLALMVSLLGSTHIAAA